MVVNMNPIQLDITPTFEPSSPLFAELQKKVDEFKVEWDSQVSLLPAPSDRELFRSEVEQLWQTLTITLKTLSACQTPYAEILQKMRFSLDSAKAQLTLSLTQFKVQSASFVAASKQFEERTRAPSKLNFAAFKASPIRVSPIPTYARKPKVDMETKKTELARCVQLSMDPESILGAEPCLAHHSKGLSEAEKKELAAFVPEAIQGKAINELAIGPKVVANGIDAVVGTVVKGLALSAISEACLELDPQNYAKNFKEAQRALNGENPELNRALAEAAPDWVKNVGRAFIRFNHTLIQLDKASQARFRTIPGVVHEGILGGLDLTIGAAIPLASRGIPSFGTITRFLKDESGAVRLISKDTLNSNNLRLAAKINQVLRKEPHTLASFALVDAFDTLQSFIPAYSGKTGKEIWARALQERISSINKVHYFKKYPDRSIAKVTGDRGSFVIRDTVYLEEVLNELTGLEFLRSLQLRHLSVPDPIGLGQYRSHFFLAKTYMEGPTLFELMQKRAFSPLLEASEQVGRALGELQSKGFPMMASTEKAECLLGSFLDKLEDLGLKTTANMQKLLKAFREAPGPATYGFGDIHTQQFVFSSKGLGLIDAEQVSGTFTGSKLPVGLASKEYQEFLNMFELDGLTAGLTREEIKPLQEAFKRGFTSEYKGTHSASAEKFFEAYSHLDIAYHFMDEPAKREIVKYHIDQFYGKMGKKPLHPTHKIVKMATQTAKEIDVVGVMKSNLVPHYAEAEPISAFVKKTLNLAHFKLLKEANPYSGNHLYTIQNMHGEPIAFVKDYISTRSVQQGFIPELVSYAFLRRQRLKHAALPEIMAVGKYASHGAERGLVMYEFIPGDTMTTLLTTPGRMIPAKEAGRALGEINAITAGSPVSEAYLEHKIQHLSFRAMSALKELESLGITTPFSMKDVVRISNEMRRRPGPGGVTHGDAHPGNLIYREPQLTMIDPGSLIQSITSKGIPQGIPTLDYYQMLINLRNYGIKQGFSQAKISQLAAQFTAGYQELFHLSLTQEVERFAELYWHTYTLNTQLTGDLPHKAITTRTLKILESKFCHSATISEIPTVLGKSK